MTVGERDYRTYGLVGTILFHLALLLLFLFSIFTAPDPPLGGGDGVVLNYGIDEAGFGDIQTTAPANESKNTEDSRPSAERVEKPVEPEVKAEPIKPIVEEKLVTSDEESPINVKVVEKDPPKVVEQPKEEVKVVERPKSLYPGKSKTENSSGNGTAGTSNQPTGNNNGDRPGSVGDQGDPNGSIDSKSLYGKPGSGGSGGGSGTGNGTGANLNMPGWRYDVRPKTDPYENETGKIVFRITIDANGEIESVLPVESNVSPQVVKWYREQVYKTPFSRINTSTPSDRGATGTITFIIRSR